MVNDCSRFYAQNFSKLSSIQSLFKIRSKNACHRLKKINHQRKNCKSSTKKNMQVIAKKCKSSQNTDQKIASYRQKVQWDYLFYVFINYKTISKYIHTYIIGHYKSSVRIIDLVSHTISFKVDTERQIF